MSENIIKYIRKKAIPISVIGICIYALYLRIMHLYYHKFWEDEMIQIMQLKGTFLELVRSRPQSDFGSYLSGDYYLMYPFFKIFSYNKWGLAIPHIIATVIGLYILYLICKRYYKSAWGYLVTFAIVCFNPTLINHATEIRVYAVLPTLAVGALYLFQVIADSNFDLSGLKKAWAVIFFVIVIWFHVYGVLMFISSFLFVILARYRTKDFRLYMKKGIYFAALVLSIAMPLWLYSIFGPRPNAGLYAKSTAGTFHFIPNPLHNLIGFMKGVFCNLVGHRKLYFLFIGIIFPFIFSYKERYKQLLFLFINNLIPIGLILISVLASAYWFMQRQFVWGIPLFAFFLGWAWDSFFIMLKSNKIKRRRNPVL